MIIASTDDPFASLRPEVDAEDGTFLLKLRCEFVWDKVAFAKLLSAMGEAAINGNKAENIPKWVAEGFWYLSKFIANWSSHPDFPRKYPDKYYDLAYDAIDYIAEYFFMGHDSYGMKMAVRDKVRELSSAKILSS